MGNANKKVAIYNPYLDTLGGGERYTMAFALACIALGYQVDVEWKDASIKQRLEKRFGMKLRDVRFVDDVKKGDGYDVCFWVSDGSVPLMRSRKNLLHFQVPFKNVNGKSLLNKMKFVRINKIICNSYFTKGVIDKEYGVDSIVVYPPVDVHAMKPLKKKNQLLYVGRFSQLEQSKHQDILIEAFREFHTHGGKGWNLVLAGGADVGVGNYVTQLKERATDFPIEILESPSFALLKKLFGESKIFWSASGYGVNEDKEPRKTEHFGITVIEAMAAGAVPFAYNAGGHKETIADGENGFLWKTEDELIRKTLDLIQDTKTMRVISASGKKDSKIYEYERFEAQIGEILAKNNEKTQ